MKKGTFQFCVQKAAFTYGLLHEPKKYFYSGSKAPVLLPVKRTTQVGGCLLHIAVKNSKDHGMLI